MNLYNLTEQYKALEDAAYNEELDYAEFDRILSEIEDDIESKVDGYCKVIASLKADAAALKAEEDRLAARRRSLINNAERLRDVLSTALDAQGRDKIKTPMFTVYHTAKNSLEITDLDGIPDEYIKPHRRTAEDIDKKAITAYIKETGEVLPYARLVVGRSLSIR